jgi:hypothetical protein
LDQSGEKLILQSNQKKALGNWYSCSLDQTYLTAVSLLFFLSGKDFIDFGYYFLELFKKPISWHFAGNTHQPFTQQ